MKHTPHRSKVIQQAAAASYWFVETKRRQRHDPSAWVYELRQDAPVWVHEFVRKAQADMFPDDIRYQMIAEAIRYTAGLDPGDDTKDDYDYDFADYSEDAFAFADEYIDPGVWLESHPARAAYCDEAQAEGLVNAAIPSRSASMGQYVERREVFRLVVAALREHIVRFSSV